MPLLSFSIFFLNSCAPKLDTVEAPIEQPEEFSLSGEEELTEEWWTSFHDSNLDTIVAKGLRNNLQLAGSWEQFRAAMAVVKMESTFLLPDIDASARTALSRPEPDFAGGENLQIGLSASYELDLWGRIQSGNRSRRI